MEGLDNLLRLIEEGNEEKILAEEELTKAFKMLCKYNLVEIKEDGIFFLTKKGMQAKSEGAAKYISRQEVEKFTKDFSPESIKKEKISFKVSFLLLILFFTILLIIKIAD